MYYLCSTGVPLCTTVYYWVLLRYYRVLLGSSGVLMVYYYCTCGVLRGYYCVGLGSVGDTTGALLWLLGTTAYY